MKFETLISHPKHRCMQRVMDMKILFIASDVKSGQATKHRVEFPAEILEDLGHDCTIIYGKRLSFFDRTLVSLSPKSIVHQLSNRNWYDVIILESEASPLGRGCQLIAALTDTPFIFDFSDALYTRENIMGTNIPNPAKMYFNLIIQESDYVTAGSKRLYDYAHAINENTSLLPTPVNTNIFDPQTSAPRTYEEPVIGWMGSGPDHVKNLRVLVEPLERLARDINFRFRIISALSDEIENMFSSLEQYIPVDYGFEDWVSMDQIANEMMTFDVAALPLNLSDEFMIGKNSTKVTEHLAMKISVVASNEVSYADTITHGKTGYLADSEDEWYRYLKKLLVNRNHSTDLAQNGYEMVRNQYTTRHYAVKLEEVCRSIVKT